MAARRSQQGTTSVEFAVIGLVLFTVIFALIDLSRLFWNVAALNEATRRGARVAAVCPVDVENVYVKQTALFEGLIPTLGIGHITIEYLDEDGVELFNPEAADYPDIRFVRVSIQNFDLQTFIPGLQTMIRMPAFATTIPRESLGRVGTDDVDC